MEKKVKKEHVGAIIKKGDKFYFQNAKGQVFDVVQNAETKQLYKDGCVVKVKLSLVNGPEPMYFVHVKEIVSQGVDPLPQGKAIADVYGLTQPMPKQIFEEIKSIPDKVNVDDFAGWTDLRDIPFITIDPDSAKDFDDAVYACRNEDGTYTLKVAIANVAHYVDKNSEIFRHAMRLGNSSYVGDICYPMLHTDLSNGICSLNENEDRLVMCTTCTMNEDGELLNYMLEPAIIRSRHRLTYKEADYLYFGENVEGDTADHSDKVEETRDIMEKSYFLDFFCSLIFSANALYCPWRS